MYDQTHDIISAASFNLARIISLSNRDADDYAAHGGQLGEARSAKIALIAESIINSLITLLPDNEQLKVRSKIEPRKKAC